MRKPRAILLKTVRELRDGGDNYRPCDDPSLTEEYLRAARLLHEYNAICFADMEARRAVLARLLGSMGENCRILSPFHCDFGYNLHVGDNFFANTGLVVLDTARVTIGNDVLIGPQVGIYAASHPLEPDVRAEGYEYAWPITIGDGAWIGGHASILPGVNIGRGSVVGAGSVVVHDVPDGCVVAGNPARIIRWIADTENQEI